MLKERILAATKQAPSDLVFVDIQIVDVFSQELYVADVAVSGGYFVGIGDYRGYGKKEIDGSGRTIIPGLIDAHAHIESTLVTPVAYSNASLARGITGVIADPHEIANVAGAAGIGFMIENSRLAPMDFYFMLPSCVPATSFEHSGCVLRADDLEPLYAFPEVLGLAEVMDFPAVFAGDEDMLRKLENGAGRGRPIDGHAAGFTPDQLNGYGAAGIRTDHECDSAAGLVERVRRGIYTLIRQGTVCKDLLNLLPAVTEKNAPLLCFATDDKHLDELIDQGGIDASVRLAMDHGIPPATALQMASLNVARCYRLTDRGAVAPGYRADFSIVSDLDCLKIEQVYKDGKLVADRGRLLHPVAPGAHPPPSQLMATVAIPEITEKELVIDMHGCTRANIIEVVPGSIVTNHLVEEVEQRDGRFVISTEKDQLKIAVIERHHNLGTIGVGIVKGFRLERGAIATTIAHDSHNLIAVGTNEADMTAAVREIRNMQGGIAVVDGGRTLAALPLEICGLMTSRTAEEVVDQLARLQECVAELAPECSFNPFLALSFMSLVVIPQLKISDSGLFDCSTFGFIEVPVRAGG